METVADPAVDKLEPYKNRDAEKEVIEATLAGYYARAAIADAASSPEKAEHWRREANTWIGKARQRSAEGEESELLWVVRGLIDLVQADSGGAEQTKESVSAAIRDFSYAFDVNSQSFSGTLGRACAYFAQEDYPNAFKNFAKAIKLNPGCSASVRVGLGLSLYNLEHFDAARKALKRAVELEPTNGDALAALAVLERSHPEAKVPESGTAAEKRAARIEIHRRVSEYLQRAFQLSANNAMVLNHLAIQRFGQWHPLEGTVRVVKGSKQVRTDGTGLDLAAHFQEGAPIAIGRTVCTVDPGYPVTATSLQLSEPFPGESADGQPVQRRRYEEALGHAQEAKRHTTNKRILAESLYLEGRCHHALGDYAQAHECYAKSMQLDLQFALPHFGIAQTFVQQGNDVEAAKHFEKVLTFMPNCREAMKSLGVIYTRNGQPEKALAHLKHVCELYEDDAEAWIDRAQLLQTGSDKKVSGALKAYARAAQILEKRRDRMPREMASNIGALYHRRGKLTRAGKYYVQALRLAALEHGVAADRYEDVRFHARNVTITYNLARLHEDQGLHADAKALYLGILREHPNYVDCYLRLGCMARDQGLLREAARWFQRPIDTLRAAGLSAEACVLLGNMHITTGELDKARDVFSLLLADRLDDPYAEVALANISLLRFKTKQEAHRAEQLLEDAMKRYTSVLSKHPRNIYAANGIGLLHAVYNKPGIAKYIFSAVRESSESVAPAWRNLAHAYLKVRDFKSAEQMYRAYIKRFTNGADVQSLVLLARALYETAVHASSEEERMLKRAIKVQEAEKDAAGLHAKASSAAERAKLEATREAAKSQLAETHDRLNRAARTVNEKFHQCEKVLRKAIHLDPANLGLRYNLALAHAEGATQVLQRAPRRRKLAEVRTAVANTGAAVRTFSFLVKEGEQLAAAGAEGGGGGSGAGAAAGGDAARAVAPQLPFSLTTAKERLKWLMDNTKEARKQLDLETKRDEAAARERIKQRQRAEDAEQKVAQEKLAKLAAEQAEREERQRQMRDLHKAVDAEHEMWLSERQVRAQVAAETGKRKKGRKPQAESFEVVQAPAGAAAPAAPAADDSSSSDSDSSDEDDAADFLANILGTAGSSDDEAGGDGAAAAEKRKAEDSDDDAAGDAEPAPAKRARVAGDEDAE